jgi:hypothetical protein
VLSLVLTILHEAVLGRATKWLPISADGLWFARIALALLHERGLGRARERLSSFADSLRLACAALLTDVPGER